MKQQAITKELHNSINIHVINIQDFIEQIIPKSLLSMAYSHLSSSMFDVTCGTETPHESFVIVRLLEYAHAVYASKKSSPTAREITQEDYTTLLNLVDALYQETQLAIILSTNPGKEKIAGGDASSFEFWAKTNWASIRRNRYAPHDLKFFRMMLQPHAEIIKSSYGISFDQLINGINKICQTISWGFGKQIEEALIAWKTCVDESEASKKSLEQVISEFCRDTPDNKLNSIEASLGNLWKPNSQYLNISKITNWPQALIADLSFQRGEANRFFEEGEQSGWMLKTLPCRAKPFLQLDDGSYAFEPTFAIEALYRAIQRGLLAKNKKYAEQWNERQKLVSETAFPKIFASQLSSAKIYSSVAYEFQGKELECDCIIEIDDTLLVIEAKAGAYSLASPIDDFNDHLKRINDLLLIAYSQAKNFLEYLNSADKVSISKKIDGKIEKIAELQFRKYRTIIPIGLTVDNLAPFTGLLKSLPEAAPILGKHAFLAFAIDDLFPLTEFLPTTSELIHFLEVHQFAAMHPMLSLHDNMDHLGAYIRINRYDALAKEHKDADSISIQGMSDILDRYYYEVITCEEGKKDEVERPIQNYPIGLLKLFDWLEAHRPDGWLDLSSSLRNLNDGFRKEITTQLENGIKIINAQGTHVFFLVSKPAITFIQDIASNPLSDEAIYRIGSAHACTFDVEAHATVHITYGVNDNLERISFKRFGPPSPVRKDYAEILGKAKELKAGLGNKIQQLKKVGRNDKCPCGSENKFKRCHGNDQ